MGVIPGIRGEMVVTQNKVTARKGWGALGFWSYIHMYYIFKFWL